MSLHFPPPSRKKIAVVKKRKLKTKIERLFPTEMQCGLVSCGDTFNSFQGFEVDNLFFLRVWVVVWPASQDGCGYDDVFFSGRGGILFFLVVV